MEPATAAALTLLKLPAAKAAAIETAMEQVTSHPTRPTYPGASPTGPWPTPGGLTRGLDRMAAALDAAGRPAEDVNEVRSNLMDSALAIADVGAPVSGRLTEPGDAEDFSRQVLAAGHEGVVIKALDAGYQAGRRGAAWVKVKPVHTLDLVVLAVEWGSGRRRGLLSNIHLGARDPGSGGFVMLGKTFKGMTDEMLAWQTERFLALETHRDGHVVFVRPEQVVEVAFDGVQRSTRYPGGMALRFARVVRYREDKHADEADTVETVRTLTR